MDIYDAVETPFESLGYPKAFNHNLTPISILSLLLHLSFIFHT